MKSIEGWYETPAHGAKPSFRAPHDDAPQAALGVTPALAFGRATGHVGAGVGIGAQAHQQDGVQGAVELAVAAAVEPVAGHLPGGGGDGVGAGQGGKGCLGAEPAGMRPADQHLGGAERSHARDF